MGLETEYALRLPSECAADTSEIASPRDAYEAIAQSLRQRMSTAEADPTHSGKHGIFLGTGGVVWFECVRPSTNLGLVEGATPECRDPYDLVAAQRAQDRILEEAAEQHGVTLLKNCRDAQGRAYGAQESYEIEFVRGLWKQAWRLYAIFVLLPVSIAVNGIASAIMVGSMVLLPFTAALTFLLWPFQGRPARTRTFDYLIGPVWRRGWNMVEVFVPGYLSRPILWCILALVWPMHWLLQIGLKLTRLDRMQADMSPFLVSRMIISGAGHLSSAGHFELSDKAGAIHSVSSCPEFSRAIFSIGQFLKPILLLVRFREALESRQRVQISIGDSNLCESAEYLRVGTTALVIDAQEAGELRNCPRLVDPIQAMRLINSDPTLRVRVPLQDGRSVTALEIQRQYWDACQRYIATLELCQEAVPDRVYDVLHRWSAVLDQLEHNPESLVGKVDWITKRYLLRKAGDNLPHAARKKIDLRYHELSQAGYFRRLEQAGLHRRVVAPVDVARATRLPPSGTPAMARAAYIREFSGSQRFTWRTTRSQ